METGNRDQVGQPGRPQRFPVKFVERALIAAVRRLPGCSGVNRVVVRL